MKITPFENAPPVEEEIFIAVKENGPDEVVVCLVDREGNMLQRGMICSISPEGLLRYDGLAEEIGITREEGTGGKIKLLS